MSTNDLLTTKTPSTVIEALHYWAKMTPNKKAFCFIDNKGDCFTSISFLELKKSAQVFADTVLFHAKKNDRIALILPTGPEFIIAFLGSLLAGTIPVPLSQPTRQHGTENIRHIINNAKPTYCITNKLLFEDLTAEFTSEDKDNLIHIIAFSYPDFLVGNNKKSVKQKPHRKIEFPLTDDTAFLQYTSGSTSAPKGVIVSHKNIFTNHKMIREVFGHNNETRQLNWMPLYHDMGLIGHVLHPICNGHTSFLMDPFVFVQRPRIWLESISQFRITSTGGPNFCYQHCVKRIKPHSIQSLDLSCLKVAYNGAEPINPSVIDDFYNLCKPIGFNRDNFLPCFGLAEATLLVSGIRHDEALKYFNASKESIAKGFPNSEQNIFQDTKSLSSEIISFPSLGKAATGITINIINPETKNTCKPLVIGEVCIQGENITRGYWENDEATRNAFITINNKSYLRTGDLGFLNEESEIFITGRLKDLIIIDGKNHYPQDIEFTTQAVDDLLKENSCAVFTIDDSINIKNVNNLIVVQELDRSYRNKANKANKNTLQTIKEKIKLSISKNHSLAVNDVVLIDCNTMPKTTSGKIKRHHARYLYEHHLLKEVN